MSTKCDPIIEVRDLYVNFYTYAGIVKAIDGVSFKICRGETYCLVGETGCGKSVTAKSLTGLIRSPGKIEKGEVLYYPEPGAKPINLLQLSEDDLRKIRGSEISYIFQDPSASLDPLYTIGYQVSETMYEHGRIKSIKEGIRRAIDILRKVLMPDPETRIKNYPHELSGGMKQRSVIGISLSNNPKLVIADEPTTALDATVQDQIMDLLKKLKEKENLTVLLITHNMGLVADMCDRVAVMYAGRIVEEADVYELFKNPYHPYTKALLRAVPNPLTKMEKLESIPGTVPNLINPPQGCRFHPRCPYKTDICEREKPPDIWVGPGHRVSCWLYVEKKESGG
ncbi:ABC transporter ATP-binding protein [Staphylothermus hellenicus]|uniref:Nickel import system ATP-binding protein NikD n=1 Tax=Staphylothermus hellenicus (strain DSM 12710 / JCM 10830 / BK20S6-10-b1 / P8) TaxID=591019 RepID=D7DBP6_STAHD|nr:ABC transporter ATP-binding protein [Staphylothermus hellenicus]ADI31593.1 oligopeptide/dipeptide ABC transporter, ATPase subunit [Staphylothermus hellenicus DSM 12710]